MAVGVLTRLKRTEHPAGRYLLLRGRGLLNWVQRGHVVRRRAIRRQLESAPEPSLHIGAGPMRLDGWLNTDLIGGDAHLDLERPLPLPDASLAYVFGEHVIGSLSEQAGMRLLRELHRVLRPGGVLRLTTPDLQKLIAIYRDENPMVRRDDYARYLDDETAKAHATPCQLFNDLVRLWGIRYTYDEEDLTRRLREAGFAEVERVEPGESRHAALRGLERHGEPWVNRAEALCLEATRR
jgi:predicted SAM-dependent methyltransferase